MELVKHIRRAYLSSLLSSKTKKKNAVFAIKNNIDFPELCLLADEGFPKSPNILKYVFGNPLPNSYESLGDVEIVWAADDIEKEINWLLLTIRQYKSHIRLFLFYKNLFESNFLVGNYTEAEKYLTKIETEVCFSLWSLESRFLLAENFESPEANKSILSNFNKTNKGKYAKHYAYSLSNKAEKLFAVKRYNDDLHYSLAKMKGDFAEENRQHYYIRLNKFEFNRYSKFKEIITIDNQFSVVDRYLLLIDVLKLMLIKGQNNETIKTFLFSRIQYLCKKFDDKKLHNLFISIKPGELLNHFDKNFDIKILDQYTTGLYNEVIDELKIKLIKQPSIFEYYLLYVKSHLYLKRKFEHPEKSNSFQNDILKEVYGILSKEINPYADGLNLSRKIKQLNNFEINAGILNFLHNEVDKNKNWIEYNKFSFTNSNPIFSEVYAKDDDKKQYLNFLTRVYPKSITVDFFAKKNNDDFEFVYDKINIPEINKKIELAKYYQRKNNFTGAIGIWKNLLDKSKDIIPVYEVSIFNLFDCYVMSNCLNEAIKLYVEAYLYNQFIVQKIDCTNLYNSVNSTKFKAVEHSIDLPLFYTISNADENEVHIALELFNFANNAEKPSDLFTKKISVDQAKFFLFLQICCTTDIFKHSISIDGTKERVAERIEILKYLLQNDKTNTNTYQEELNELTNSLIIQEGIQQLDESKIYVNESGLINYELKEYEGLYNSFKTISKITKDDTMLYILDRSGKLKSINLKEDSLKEELSDKFSAYPLADAFKECFDVITDKFLNSKFGISAYLSTRIRHGVLLGELRPIFEKYHLISQRDSNTEKYTVVEYWNLKYNNIPKNFLEKLQNTLADFSKKTDTLINDLIKKNLQIKLDDSYEDGWFDYVFDNTTLSLFAIKAQNINSYNDFIKYVLEILWERTDRNLDLIRKKIDESVKDLFLATLNDLEKDLNVLNIKSQIPEVYTNITTCSTEIQVAVSKIATWFNRSGSQISDFELDKIITIIYENISHSYPLRNIQLSKNINFNPTIKGEFYYHFADLFRIFFDNTLKHSIQDHTIIPVYVNSEKLDGILTIEINNMYPDMTKIEVPKINEESIDSKKLHSEGKSGFVKAEKILKSDLRGEFNSCKFIVDFDGKFCATLSINLENITI